MTTTPDTGLPSHLAQPLGQKSLSSSLSTALKVAHVLFSIGYGLALVSAVFGIGLSIARAFDWVPAKVFSEAGGRIPLHAHWTIAVPYLAFAVIGTRGALKIVERLQRIFASFVANEPFAPENAIHLRSIWVTLVVVEISRIVAWVLMHGLTALFAANESITFPKGLGDPLDLVRLFLVFVVLILAEVFRRGTQLRNEAELTV